MKMKNELIFLLLVASVQLSVQDTRRTYLNSDTGKRRKRQTNEDLINREKLFVSNSREIDQSVVASIPENIATRFQGGSPQIPNKVRSSGIKYPWSCSLRSSGYRSFHKCGVTMLSGPPGPTILVSAAHCNYICKDADDNLNESCCCNQIGDPGYEINCRKSVHCGPDPKTVKAEPRDLNIVCGEISVEIENQYFSTEKEVVLKVKEFHNYPLYNPEDILKGYDIAVYIVDDENLKDSSYFNKGNIWPTCLPKGDDQYETGGSDLKARVSGWDVPDFLSRSIGALNFKNFLEVEQGSYFSKEVLMEKIDCKDHPKMGTDTYYPSTGSCFRGCQYFLVDSFGGVSGVDASDITATASSRTKQQTFIRQSINPTLFTDARCFMPWIAANYGMKMPDNYVMPPSCWIDHGTGNKDDKDNENCEALVLNYAERQKCNLTRSEELYGIRECWAFSTEGYTDHSYNCYTETGAWGTCVNNCPGVRGNAVVVGGGAVLLASSLGGSSLTAPFTVAAAALLGTMAMSNTRNSRCPDVCQLAAGGCIRGRRCAILLRTANK